jgi:CDP-ribitol ribitolphosphotransferase / teichoic acid ribitol-phosphate polymerase
MEAGARDPGIALVSIRWERVQLILDARIAAGTEIDPAGLRLEPPAGGEAMAPTRTTVDGDRLTVRYNVMVGPGLAPLGVGRWTLRGPVALDDPRTVDTETASGVFPLSTGLYTVAPHFSPDPARGADGGSLAFDVSYDEDVRREDPGAIKPIRQRATTGVRRAVFRLLVTASKLLAGRGRKRILFTSRLISDMSGNLKVVHDRMVERGLDREADLISMLKPGITERWAFTDRFRLASTLARADVIVLDDTFPPLNWVELTKHVRIIQLWHASGAFKTVGYSRAGKPGDLNPFLRTHKNYTAAIVSGDVDVPFYAEAFGIPEERVVPTGIPRMDRFFDENARVAGVEAARAAFPEIAGRETILFAPTYRGETIRDASYGFEHLDYAALHALCVERDAVVIIKMHPFVQEPVAIPEPFRDRIIDGSTAGIDVNDLMFAVDLVITDYSSVVFEFSTLGRPMLFFAYDLEEYVATRDFYVPFESFVPGRIVRTFPELLDAIRREDYESEKVAAFAAGHFAHLDGGSTDRVIDELILAP